ncbi:MAG: peptidoglycan recognition family protein [Syntrophomonadaceae bacterium]|nr:peptidoglycan recognition family protein [Syntrophomonadaceae bacterium]
MSNKTEIILHHSATADGAVLKDFDAIRKYHIEHNGWRDIGYHYVVELVEGQFKVLHGRSESDEGAHCMDHNKKSIGICCVGNFELTQPPEGLYYVVAELCRDIMSRHPIERICAHKDFSATACPGRFSMSRESSGW